MRTDRVFSMFLKVDNVSVEGMSSGGLFQATGPATQNARLPSCSFVLGTTKSPRAAVIHRPTLYLHCIARWCGCGSLGNTWDALHRCPTLLMLGVAGL